jgi:putative ABC transport system permease protein
MFRNLALPVVALQFAMATVLAVQALVTTFEATFDQWLAQRLSAELYVQVPDGADAQAGERALAQLDGLGDWHRVRSGKAQLLAGDGAAEPLTMDLMALSPITPLVTDWTLLASVDDPWAALASGGVMVNEQLARRQGIQSGQSLRVKMGESALTMPVVAVYADYGRPAAEVLVHGDSLPSGFRPSFQSFSINPGALAVDDIARRLRAEWQVADLVIRDNASIQALASQVFQQTFLLTRAISVLTLVLASLSLLVMGWVFFSTRAWYFRLLMVWGLQRREAAAQLTRLSLSLTSAIALLALPLGVWLTWVLVHRINPLAFGWPPPDGKPPFIYDFATSAVARGDIELHRREGKKIPEGWGIDGSGQSSQDPAEVLSNGALLTFGGHKGSALSIMIELIAGPLIGDLTSAESLAYDDGAKASPYHGELILAMDPKRFLGDALPQHMANAETLFSAITAQGARLPSQRRYQARERSDREGISIPEPLYHDLVNLT